MTHSIQDLGHQFDRCLMGQTTKDHVESIDRVGGGRHQFTFAQRREPGVHLIKTRSRLRVSGDDLHADLWMGIEQPKELGTGVSRCADNARPTRLRMVR